MQRATVDASVGTNFDVMANTHRAELLDLFPNTVVGRKTEAIRTNHHAGVEQAAVANMTAFRHRNPRPQLSVSTNGGTALNDTQGSHDRAGMNPSLRINHCARVDPVADRSFQS